MALIDTAPVYDCENNLRMACADELNAQKQYREIKRMFQEREYPEHIKNDILRRLDEIIKDEDQHLGSLMYCLNLLNPSAMQEIDNGAKGA